MWALKILHEKNWRESLRVLEFHHPPHFHWILAATPGFQNLRDLRRQTTGVDVLSWSPFYLFLGVFGWLGDLARDWIHGKQRVSPFYHQHWNLTQALERYHFQFDPLSRVSLSLDVVVGEEDELEEDVEQCLSCLEGVIEVEWWEPEEELGDKPGTTIGTKFSVLHCIRIPFFNEMWFLTIDPFIRISVFIAKLSKRQYCWRVLEDFHSQEYIQLFDIHCSLLMRLHFPIGGYDCRRTARFRQSIHFSIIQVLVVDHMHRRSGVDNKLSFLRFKSWCRQAPFFRRWEEFRFVFLLWVEYTFGQHPRCFTGTSLLPLCLLLRPILKIWSVGATLVRFTWANYSERRILVSIFSVTCNSFREFNTLGWFLHVWALP